MVEIDSSQLRRTPRHTRKRLETRERLYRAALHLFEEQGFDDTTVQQITEAADVGKGTFFHHFPTKDHVLAAYWDDFNCRILDQFEFIQEATAYGRLLAAMAICGRAAQSESKTGRWLLAHFFTSPVLASSDRENEVLLRSWLERFVRDGVERGEFCREADIDSFLHLLIANLSTTVQGYFIDGGDELVELLDRRTRLLLAALENRS